MEKDVARTHEMHLFKEPFEWICIGEKTIEVRLYDEKRRGIQIGDTIRFEELPENKEEIMCKVIGLSRFGSFKELFGAFESSRFGHKGPIDVGGGSWKGSTAYTARKMKRSMGFWAYI